jgi:uncharacterized protein (TIGR02118 family)
MMKSICALTRRADLSRAEFQRYYEEQHAPLGASHFPFRRYARNHTVDHPDIGFDTISEFWAEDIPALAALMDGPVGEIMRADERKFMDQSRIASATADEHVLSAGAPAGPDGLRCAVLVDWSEADEAAAWGAVLDWAKGIAAGTPGVSLDFTRSWGEPAFPARAVLWLPSSAALTTPPPIVSTRVLQVRRAETPAEALLAA